MSLLNRFSKQSNLLMSNAEVKQHFKYSSYAFMFAAGCSVAFVYATKYDIKKQEQQSAVIANRCQRPVK